MSKSKWKKKPPKPVLALPNLEQASLLRLGSRRSPARRGEHARSHIQHGQQIVPTIGVRRETIIGSFVMSSQALE